MPITIGGGISDREDVKNYFLNGADKILVNSNIYNDDLMKMIEEEWGKQSLSIMIDCAKNEHEMDYKIMINCGKNLN